MGRAALVLTVSGDTVDEIREKLGHLVKEFGVDVGAAQAATDDKPAGGKRGRKPKETTLEPVPNGVAGPVSNGHHPSAADDLFSLPPPAAAPAAQAAPQAAVAAPSREQVNRALLAVQTKAGVQVARKIITDFGAKRVPELQEKDFNGVLQACQKALT